MKIKLPTPGVVGAPASPEHCKAAARYVAEHPGNYSAAYLDLAQRGEALLLDELDAAEWAACGKAMADAESAHFEHYEPHRLDMEYEDAHCAPFEPWGPI